ncbi:replication-relaxation family protein [Dactylosporangium sp. NPDC048998]|uniref:replication-relaxation family protein n=1 Tax=Dactylosporangium sp. NPDC048998 TaxID=3363976 RepID=UPI00371EDB56
MGAFTQPGDDVHAMTYTPKVRPDGHGIWSEDGTTMPFFLEFDTGTEPLHVLTGKVAEYTDLARTTGQVWPVPAARRPRGQTPNHPTTRRDRGAAHHSNAKPRSKPSSPKSNSPTKESDSNPRARRRFRGVGRGALDVTRARTAAGVVARPAKVRSAAMPAERAGEPAGEARPVPKRSEAWGVRGGNPPPRRRRS